MIESRMVGVIDIGKSNAKVVAVDCETRQEVQVIAAPNQVQPGPPYRHHDVDTLWRFILEGLCELARRWPIRSLVTTTHGAAAALLDAEGNLALPVLDYEDEGPNASASAYDGLRPRFEETGSPRLPGGLNLGAQIHWQLQMPGAASRIASILTYPQYWSWRLCGVQACEVTSLGCHTDLWCPRMQSFSSLAARLLIANKMAPLRSAFDRLGVILPAVAAATGLDPKTSVYCGIHDSNASLLPHLMAQQSPFAVISTGTWVITMAIGKTAPALDPARDTLINVSAFGDPVPSARFMGGREYEAVMAGWPVAWERADVAQVLEQRIMLLRAVENRSGPFPGRRHRWTVSEDTLSGPKRHVAASFYLALMTSVCLAMTGASGPVIVEGPFARNSLFIDMLAAAIGRSVTASRESATGTSLGAALLTIGGGNETAGQAPALVPVDEAMRRYALAWNEASAAPRMA